MESRRICVRLPKPILAVAQRKADKLGLGLSVWIRGLVEDTTGVDAVDGRRARHERAAGKTASKPRKKSAK